ncbi:hypothetical protein WJX84_006911 [Apatococcus fuscideae]|uniref:Uncharacterized protein n=1 Tax=Apatococcus fuscideae TaxID=2026836 RepID=A0AAW1RI52_9CHLO
MLHTVVTLSWFLIVARSYEAKRLAGASPRLLGSFKADFDTRQAHRGWQYIYLDDEGQARNLDSTPAAEPASQDGLWTCDLAGSAAARITRTCT